MYCKSFKEGGLAQGQVEYLYEASQKRKSCEYRFLAAIHGVDLPAEDEEKSTVAVETAIEKEFEQAKPSNGLFGDPAEYEKMSENERSIASQALMAKFKNWAKDTSLG